MDDENPVLQLCVAVTRAEFAGQLDEARRLAWLAWQAAADDFEACIAAHYVARYQLSPEGALRWNQLALERAQAVNDSRVAPFYASLFLNMGRAYENIGEHAPAQGFYSLAARLGVEHQGEDGGE